MFQISWNEAWIGSVSLERANLCSAERDSWNETQTGTSWNEGWNEDRAWNEGPMGIQALFLDLGSPPRQGGGYARTHRRTDTRGYTQTDRLTHAVTHAQTDGQTDRRTD